MQQDLGWKGQPSRGWRAPSTEPGGGEEEVLTRVRELLLNGHVPWSFGVGQGGYKTDLWPLWTTGTCEPSREGTGAEGCARGVAWKEKAPADRVGEGEGPGPRLKAEDKGSESVGGPLVGVALQG